MRHRGLTSSIYGLPWISRGRAPPSALARELRDGRDVRMGEPSASRAAGRSAGSIARTSSIGTAGASATSGSPWAKLARSCRAGERLPGRAGDGTSAEGRRARTPTPRTAVELGEGQDGEKRVEPRGVEPPTSGVRFDSHPATAATHAYNPPESYAHPTRRAPRRHPPPIVSSGPPKPRCHRGQSHASQARAARPIGPHFFVDSDAAYARRSGQEGLHS